MPYIETHNVNQKHLEEVLRVRREVLIDIPLTPKIPSGIVEIVTACDKPLLEDWFEHIYKSRRELFDID